MIRDELIEKLLWITTTQLQCSSLVRREERRARRNGVNMYGSALYIGPPSAIQPRASYELREMNTNML